MTPKILVFGDRKSEEELQKRIGKVPATAKRIALCREPIVPEMDSFDGTAYVDLEKAEFAGDDFLSELAQSFDKLRIVGIAEAPDEAETLRVAQLGVAEIVNRKQFYERIEVYIHGNGDSKKAENPPAPLPPTDPYGLNAIIGHSPRVAEIKKMVDHLGEVDYPNAIIFGETGTGKDLLAKVLHYTGVRKDNNFIEVNCSAIPDELFESELFGHKKGAFTDAKNDKAGLFEFASNGTIFLDEIGNLTMPAQAKLLKILESRRLRPLGAVEEKDINVRVLAATNINLEQAVNEHRFRQDLLFRLNLIAIHLPPLRERKEDIPDLARFSFDFYRTLYSRSTLSLDETALEALQQHNWPGNVRELRNVVERAVLLTTADRITATAMKEAIKNGRVTARERRKIIIEIPDQGISLKAIEKQAVGEILNMVQWNRTQAASLLGISRARLRRIMEENGLENDKRGTD
ncbi:hypothetical protein TRIP_C20431 [Candidatus Zixiibacteriota bacterium]|nr:hypothetical protein TRIP_C20431 [candidate division Zixibacteria bacterium]